MACEKKKNLHYSKPKYTGGMTGGPWIWTDSYQKTEGREHCIHYRPPHTASSMSYAI